MSKPYASDDACYPLDETQERTWSINEIFGRPIEGTCLGTSLDESESPQFCIHVPEHRPMYMTLGSEEPNPSSGESRCFPVPASDRFDVGLPKQDLKMLAPLPQPPLYAERSFTGHGQERGGVQALLTNPSPTSAIDFIYLESLPWFMKPYLHTLKVQISGKPTATSKVIKDMYYRPAVDRRRGTQLEIHLSVPAASTVTLTYDFDKAILRYTEYPPDANRGFDVAPAVIRLISPPSNTSSKPMYLRTTSLLLPLPTPDFSMPYNVIILTSTVMALAFGTIFNFLVRRFVGADEVEAFSLRVVVARYRGKATLLIERLKERIWERNKAKEKKEQ